jgi:hypothetical protein
VHRCDGDVALFIPGAECQRMTAAVDAGTALRRALDQQLQQANSQAMKQEAQMKVCVQPC